MSETDKHTPWKPSIKIYVLSVLVGTIITVVLAGFVFATSSIVIAASMGCVLAIFGALMNENIGEAIVFSFFLGGMCGLLFWVTPDSVAVRIGTWAIPAVLGFCSSKTVYRDIP